jgi:hypothetical protein
MSASVRSGGQRGGEGCARGLDTLAALATRPPDGGGGEGGAARHPTSASSRSEGLLDALSRERVVQAQRALNGDGAVEEVRRAEDLRVLRFLERGEQAGDLGDVVFRQHPTLRADGLAHLVVHAGRVDELHRPRRFAGLSLFSTHT